MNGGSANTPQAKAERSPRVCTTTTMSPTNKTSHSVAHVAVLLQPRTLDPRKWLWRTSSPPPCLCERTKCPCVQICGPSLRRTGSNSIFVRVSECCHASMGANNPEQQRGRAGTTAGTATFTDTDKTVSFAYRYWEKE